MQALCAVIIATALMLFAYNPKTSHKTTPAQRQQKTSRRLRQRENDSLNRFASDTAVLKIPVQPGVVYLTGTIY